MAKKNSKTSHMNPHSGDMRTAALLALLLLAAGCAKSPHIYSMDPTDLEKIRSECHTVGVHLDSAFPENRVLLPAKGVWGGAKRGVLVGASLPVMLGFVSPIPGGTALGVLFAPMGALVGGVHGIFTALPEQEVENAETMLLKASDELRQMPLREDFLQLLLELGNLRTDLRFVAWPEDQVATASQSNRRRSFPANDTIDTKLSIQFLHAGLRGQYRIDPPMDIFLEIRVRLIRIDDDVVLLDEHFTCASDEEKMFRDWSAQGGNQMIAEFVSCVPDLAEKIVDDLFRVYPIEWK